MTFSSCKKSTPDPDPIAITVTLETFGMTFKMNESFDEMYFVFPYNDKRYITRIRWVNNAFDANVETSVTNTAFIPTDAVLSNCNCGVALDGKPIALKSDKLNPTTRFKVTFTSFKEGNAFVPSLKLFKEITFSVDAQTDVVFSNNSSSALYTRYIDDTPGFSTMVQNMLNSFGDDDAATPGNQPMLMDGWVEELKN